LGYELVTIEPVQEFGDTLSHCGMDVSF
jgi:hypothetical protein